jgi:hypothetical protein
MGGYFGADFSNVRIHTGSEVEAALVDSRGRAMTRGSNIHIRSGENDVHSSRGRELIGRELAHVVQQDEGRASGLNAKAPRRRGQLEMPPCRETPTNLRMSLRFRGGGDSRSPSPPEYSQRAPDTQPFP